MSADMGDEDTGTCSADRLAHWRCPLEAVLGVSFTEGNRIDVLRNGVEIFPAMLDAVADARSTIEFLTFVYWQGNIAHRFADTLAQRAHAGTRVRVLLDAVGAAPMRQELIETMQDAGVEVRWFRPPVRWKIWQADNRTHRKVLVVDGRIGFTGGVGIAAEWEGDARDEGEWRDTHFRVLGPAVCLLRGAFYANWIEAGGSFAELAGSAPKPQKIGASPLLVARTSAAEERGDVADLFRMMIALARERLRIESAYFVPDDALVALLTAASARGVMIEIMTPSEQRIDRRVSRFAGDDDLLAILEAGITVWRYQRSMLHTKVVTVDRLLACVGSANFNQRSMTKDDEVCVLIADPETVAILDRHFEEDVQLCQRLAVDAWEQRGPVRKLTERLVQPFRKQM